MTTTTAPAHDTRTPRWLRTALMASLALNLAVAGAFASAYWRSRQEAPFAAGPGNGNLLGFTALLPPDRRQAIMRQTGEQRLTLRPLRAELRASRLAARAVFLADPFDREAFAKAQAHVLEAELRARREAQSLFLTIASSLSKEERQAFARWQPEGPRGDRGPGGGGGKRPDRLRAGETGAPPQAISDPDPSAGGNNR